MGAIINHARHVACFYCDCATMACVGDMDIRVGDFRDFSVVQDIERDAARLYGTVGYDFCVEGQVRDFEELRRGVETGVLLIADVEGVAVGFALVWEVDGRAHLAELSVRCDYQGRGIGRELIGAVEEWARGRGFGEVTLTTFWDVLWNAPFYERCGFCVFEVGGERPGLLAVVDEERRAGFAVRERVVMFKVV